MTLRILVLGSAAGGGHPQWNCATPASVRAWQQVPGALRRTQASIAVTVDDENWILVNASPDFRHQVMASPMLWPRLPPRHSPIKAVVLTSGEIEHIVGLLSMRESQPFALHAPEAVLDVLGENRVFDALNHVVVDRIAMVPGLPTSIEGVRIEPFAVPGKVPLFMEAHSDGVLEHDSGGTVGLEISDGVSAFHFIPGCARVTEDLRRRLSNSSLVFFDGTLWHDDELIAAGVSAKTGTRMGHMSIDGVGGTLAAFSDLRVRRKVFIHINTTNPILDVNSVEFSMVQRAHWDVAFDGMEFEL